MKALILYDSAYGNTAKVAQLIGKTLRQEKVHATVSPVDETSLSAIESADAVIVGSPTQGGRPTPKTRRFLASLAPGVLRGKWVAAFDTRFDIRTQRLLLRVLMRIIGYAAPRIAAGLQAKGGTAAVSPKGFIVEDKDGPLRQGEVSQINAWADAIVAGR